MKGIFFYNKTNEIDGLSSIKYLAELQNIKVENVRELSYLNENPDLLIINPLPSEVEERKIEKYLSENPKTRVLYFAPTQSKEKIKKITKGSKNLEIIACSDLERANWKLLREEMGIEPNKT